MKLLSATFDNFRNIKHFSFDFDERMNILFGKNAQGKTNVIEGIYLFAGGKSFRRAKDGEMRMFGSDFTMLSAEYSSKTRSCKMAIRYRDTNRRDMYLNGARVSKLSDFIGNFRAVLFCPAHLSIVQADPSVRRAFIDGAISQYKPTYLEAIIEYQKVLEQRNALLRSYEENPEGFDLLYDVLSEKLAKDGGYITAVRAEYLEKLFGFANGLLSDMSGGGETLSYEYNTSISATGDVTNAAKNEKAYIEAIEKHREKEKIVGTSLVGAHRDDFEIFLSGRPAKTFASQGQQRSIALALKLAEGELSKLECGEYPVLLLDDVLSELDRDRKNYVLSQLTGRQVIITSCDENDFKDIDDGKKIRVENGEYEYVT